MNDTERDEVTSYVAAVAAALADLPPAVRQELLADLPEHLGEVLSDGQGPLVDRLGQPEAYAAELRSAAGVPAGVGAATGPVRLRRFAAARDSARRRLSAADRRIGPALGHERASEFLVLLRPAWWVLRGYLAAMVVAYVLDDSGQPIGLLPRVGGSEAVALLLLAAGVLASVWLGRRQPPRGQWPRYALNAASVLLVLVAVTGFLNADQERRGGSFQEVYYDDPYRHIEDVYVYDEQGRLLTGVRLFDQDGAPIRLGGRRCSPPDWTVDRDVTYPFCPELAPFRMPGPGLAPSATGNPPPSPSPSPSPAAPSDPGAPSDRTAPPGRTAPPPSRPGPTPSAGPS